MGEAGRRFAENGNGVRPQISVRRHAAAGLNVQLARYLAAQPAN
jgi:hypothetical protein